MVIEYAKIYQTAFIHKKSGIIYGILVILIIFIHLLLSQYYQFICDDAYISFRYAKNMALGHGLTWNPGEYVEGYTNFLWTAWLGFCYWLGFDIESLSLISSGLLSILSLGVVYLILREGFPDRYRILFLITLALLAVNRSWNVWASSGLETRMFTFFSLCGFYLVFLSKKRFAVFAGSFLFGLSTLTRPDGYLIFFCVILAALFINRHSLKNRKTYLICLIMPYVLITGIHLLFRWNYYGLLLPNTYYAKVDDPWPEIGLIWLRAFILEYGLIPMILMGLVFYPFYLIKKGRKTIHAHFHLLALWVFGPALAYYVIIVGGDHFEYRLFDTYMPFLEILMADLAYVMVTGLNFIILKFIAIAITIWGLVFHVITPHFRILPYADSGENNQTHFYRSIAFLQKNWPGVLLFTDKINRLYKTQSQHYVGASQESFKWFWQARLSAFKGFKNLPMPNSAVTRATAIGVLGYYVDITVIDEYGLTDRVITSQIKTSDKNKKLHSHNRMGSEEYFNQRGVNFIPVCVIDGQTRCRNPFYKDYSYMPLYKGTLANKTVLFRSPDIQWAIENFSNIQKINE